MLHGITLRIPLKPVITTTKIAVGEIKVYQVQLQLAVSSQFYIQSFFCVKFSSNVCLGGFAGSEPSLCIAC